MTVPTALAIWAAGALVAALMARGKRRSAVAAGAVALLADPLTAIALVALGAPRGGVRTTCEAEALWLRREAAETGL